MSSKVLFSHSYFYKLDPKQWKFKQPYPPLGTITAAAVLKENGHNVSLYDTNLKDTPGEIVQVLESINPKYFVIYDDGFNYLTKMCLSNMREAAFQMIQKAKLYGCTVIVSSSDATDHATKYLAQGADFVIYGEGEITLRELLSRLDQEHPPGTLSDIPGIMYLENTSLRKTQPRENLKELDSLPLPLWNLIDIQSYKDIWINNHGYFSLNLATTRGCPFKCNWCAKPIYGNRYNSRSPEHVVNEIEFLLRQYQPNHFWMCDDIFGLKPGWLQEFSALVESKKLNFKYKIQSRADLLLKEDNIDALSRSGADMVWIGAESGSQEILDAMDKGITIEQIKESTALLKSHNIKVAYFLQFGYLGETFNDINKTIKMVLNLMPDEIGISVSYPLPGTKFHETVKNILQEKQNWTDSDDLSLMFQNTFPSKFYKILHRYVHNRYRIQRGINQLKGVLTGTSGTTRLIRNFLSMLYNTPLSWIHAYQLNKISKSNASI